MEQLSNALGRLDDVFTSAIEDGDREKPAGPILLEAMGLESKEQNLLYFYELLNKAKEEANSIKRHPKINKYLDKLADLQLLFVANHVWGTKWNTFAHHIEVRGLSVTLDALSHFYSREHPEIFLEDEFLSKLRKEFESLLGEILESDLSPDLKKILTGRIEDILKSIHRYWIDGTEGLVAETQLFLVESIKNESTLQAKDKQNPLYKRAQAFLINLIIYLTPTPYDIIGSAPDIQDYWKPQFEELIQNSQQVEAVLSETDTIQEAFDKASHLLKSSEQKALSGRGKLKSLPPSKELSEDDSDNQDENNTE